MDLGVRLREISQDQDIQHFSPSDVSTLAEAAWVISTQSDLSRVLREQEQSMRKRFRYDFDYRYPTYEKGYVLAANTREILELGEKEPIPSMKRLIEQELGIPVVQEKLAERFAGATIANGRDRGIVVNEAGQNSNVFVRRMTMAHELGHLLWDPDDRLDRLKVDQYDELQTDYAVGKGLASKRDPVEIRTNAFAISFLAPPVGVRSIVNKNADAIDVLTTVMLTYGVSATAARYHIRNVAGHDVSPGAMRDLPNPSDEWVAAENMTVDWFPLKETPISRRSRFALLVVRAFRSGLISGDTASLYLRSSEGDFRRQQAVILKAN